MISASRMGICEDAQSGCCPRIARTPGRRPHRYSPPTRAWMAPSLTSHTPYTGERQTDRVVLEIQAGSDGHLQRLAGGRRNRPESRALPDRSVAHRYTACGTSKTGPSTPGSVGSTCAAAWPALWAMISASRTGICEDAQSGCCPRIARTPARRPHRYSPPTRAWMAPSLTSHTPYTGERQTDRVVLEIQAGSDGHLQRLAGGQSTQPGPRVREEPPLRPHHLPVVGVRLPVPVPTQALVAVRVAAHSAHPG